MIEAEIREVVRSEVREFVRRVVAVVDLTTTLQGVPMAQALAKLREAIEAVGRYDDPPAPIPTCADCCEPMDGREFCSCALSPKAG